MNELSIYNQHNLLYNQEKLSRYRPGGYHPVSLGDSFKDGRYKVHHKLGWGGYSTVWLANDTECDEWVAIKILTAERSEDTKELEILQLLRERSKDLPGAKYIVHLLDHFFHSGPNGNHQCLVFELLGPCVESLVKEYSECENGFEPETILRIADQLLEGVSAIHDAGLVHGDLSTWNIAFTTSHLSKMNVDGILAVIGTPIVEDLIRLDGKPLDLSLPKHLVKAASWDDWLDEDEEDIRIIDFGESFPKNTRVESLAQPGQLRVPETVFVGSFDYRVDLWRVGCIIYSVIFLTTPFWYLGDDHLLLAGMITLFGDFPPEWHEKWISMRSEPIRYVKDEKYLLENKFEDKKKDSELQPLLPIIRALMKFRPEDRISASTALEMLRGGMKSE